MTLHDLALKVGVTALLLLFGLSMSMLIDDNLQRGKGKRYADSAAGTLQGIAIACGIVWMWTLPNG